MNRNTSTAHLDVCPLCDGELQATRSHYLRGVRVNRAGAILCAPQSKARKDEGYAIRCENDHTWEEMEAALEARESQQAA